MALHVWLVEGSKIILNIEQILKVPVLAKIYNDWHNDRELMYKIFKFIVVMLMKTDIFIVMV